MAQDFAFVKSEMLRFEKIAQSSQNEKQELQISLQNYMKEREEVTKEEKEAREYLENQTKGLQKELADSKKYLEQQIKLRDEEIQQLSGQHNEQYTMAKHEANLLVSQVDDMNKELEATRKNCDDLYKTVEKQKKEMISLENEYKDLDESNKKLKESYRLMESEHNALKSVNFECGMRMKQLDDEKKRSEQRSKNAEKEKEELLEKFNNYGDQLQKANTETMEKLINKQKAKRTKLQQKIVELKGTIAKLEETIGQHQKILTETKISYEKTITELHEDMKRIKNEWEHRVYEQDLECQRKIAEQQSQYALQISQLQEEYKQIMDNKLAEIQAESQEQITQAKNSEIEIKSIFDSKIQALDKEYVPIKKHENEIEEERKKAKESIETAIMSMREEYEKEFQSRLMNADDLKAKEMDELANGYKQNIQTLEENLKKAKESQEEYEEKLEKYEQEKENYEKVGNDNNNLLEQIENLKQNQIKIIKELEGEKALRREAEIKAKATKESASDIIEKYEKASSTASKQTSECESLKAKLNEISEEKNREARKLKGLQSEKDALQENVLRLEEEKRQLNMKLQRQIEDLTEKSQNLHASIMEKRQQASEKELQDQIEMKNKLTQSEYKYKSCSEELLRIQNEYKDLEKRNQELEEALSQYKATEYENQNNINLLTTELQELTEQSKNLHTVHRNLLKGLRKNIWEKNFGLKEQLHLLKGNFLNALSTMQKKMMNDLEKMWHGLKEKAIIQEKKLHESFYEQKESLKEEMKKTLKNKESEFEEQTFNVNTKLEELIKEKNSENTQLQQFCEEIEEKNKTLFKELADTQNRLKIIQGEKLKLGKENEQLKKEIENSNSKILSIKSEVKGQTSRLKVDTENAALVAKQELDGKYKQRLGIFQKQIETLKIECSCELRALIGEFNNLKLQYQNEFSQLSQSYEHKLAQLEYSMKSEKEKAEQLKIEIERLNQDLDNAKGMHKSEIYQLETKMKYLNESLLSDTEKYKKLKLEKGGENEKLAKKLREVNAELTLKTEVHWIILYNIIR